MLKLVETRKSNPRMVLAGFKVSRKYRLACIRRYAYRKLKAIVPSISSQQKVSKIKVIEEAIKYIDELHYALLKKAPQLFGHQSKSLPDAQLSPEQFVLQLLSMPPPTVATTTPPNSGLSSPLTASSCTCLVNPRLPCATCVVRRQIMRRN